jgi:ABC-type nitrate/sulfonate/bicarbonate transport system permease component
MRTKITFMQLGCVIAVVAAWELAARLELAPPALLPPFSDVVVQLAGELGRSELWTALGQTVSGALQGLAAAALVAIPLGLLAGSWDFLERSCRILIDFGRSFPAIALIPVFLLLFGTTVTTKTIIVFIACVFPLFIQTLYGARRIEPSIVETARSYRIPRMLQLLRVALPSATPSIMTGLRLAATTAVLVAVGAEVIGGVPGIGRQLSVAQQDGATALAFAYILLAGVLGFLLARGSEALESRFLRWRPSD